MDIYQVPEHKSNSAQLIAYLPKHINFTAMHYTAATKNADISYMYIIITRHNTVRAYRMHCMYYYTIAASSDGSIYACEKLL